MTPIVLAVIGGILFLAAIALYSSPGELPSPPYSTLEIVSTFSINSIYYDVSQVSPSTAKIYVQLALRGGVQHPPAKAAAPSFYLLLSSGIHFKTCPAPYCRLVTNNAYEWSTYMEFRPEVTGPSGQASANFYVRAHSFGYASNSVTALAAIPEVLYYGPGSPTLFTEYDNAPLGSSYDWSALPTLFANGTKVLWSEPVTGGLSPGRVAVGINQANQTKNSNKTFFAGALIGLAGGALLSAVQEALHAND